MKRSSNPRAGAALAAAVAVLLAAGAIQAAPKTKIPREKALVLDWLADPGVVEKFGKMSDEIWKYAELGHQEFKSSALLADTLERAGFKVERGAAGMPTCFVATYGEGKPVIGLLGEYDALAMLSQKGRVPKKDPVVEGAPGHGCGHNTMGVAASAAAIAVKEAMVKFGLKGTIKVFGSPAEEIVASRPYMIRAGLFKDVDVVIDNHSGSEFATGYGIMGNAIFSVVYSFRGRTAHSAGGPWEGRSALDGVEIMNVAANYLREHLKTSHRLHYVIMNGGEAPNVVPDTASVWYYIRNTDGELQEMYDRVLNCAKAGALASGTELSSVRILSGVHQMHANKAVAELVHKNIALVGLPAWSAEEQSFAKAMQKELKVEEKGMPDKIEPLVDLTNSRMDGGSSDVGDVTLVAPTATVMFPGAVPGVIGHHWSNVACFYGSTAWKGLNAGAKAIAASAVDFLTKPEEVRRARAEFEVMTKTSPYKSFVPADTPPPLDFYESLMDKYRPLMEKAVIDK